jgi:uncharacterized phage-associated protein
MVSATAIARYFVKLAGAEDEPEWLTQMRLHKLLYYAQGWHLATAGSPLFASHIEAWKFGPVVRSVYPAFADYGGQPIPPHEAGASDENLDAQTRLFLSSIWNGYKQYSANELSRKTHSELPWRSIYNGRPGDGVCDAVIPQDLIKSHFEAEAEGFRGSGISLSEALRAEAAFRNGQSIDAKTMRDRLRRAV